MCSHSGIVMMLGRIAYSTSCKQKINMKSSTEADLVDMMTLWAKYYGLDISCQHKVCPYLLWQYTEITRAQYYSQRTVQHQAARELNTSMYNIFFVTLKTKPGEVKEAYCLSHMLADFSMKSLQGTTFMHMREKIQICPAIQVLLCTGGCWMRKIIAQSKPHSKQFSK